MDRHISAVTETDLQSPPFREELSLLGFDGKNEYFFMSDQIITRVVFTFPAGASLNDAANRISEECGEPSFNERYEEKGACIQWETHHTRYVLATDGKKMTLTATKY